MTANNQDDKNNKSIEKLYLKERKKNQLFLLTTVVLTILLIGSVGFNFQNKNQSTTQDSNQSQSLSGTLGQNFGGFQDRRGSLEISEFFKNDGTVDTNQVNQVQNTIPSGFEDRLLSRVSTQIDDAVKKGDITAKQGEELKTAFGISSETDAN